MQAFTQRRKALCLTRTRPVFRTDEEYDRAGLPLPIELSVSFSAVGAPAPADAELADYLLKTKAVCEETGQPFAYYSVALAFKPTEQKDPVWWAAEHIPSEEITEEKILDYLAALDCGVKANCGQSLNGRKNLIEEEKKRVADLPRVRALRPLKEQDTDTSKPPRGRDVSTPRGGFLHPFPRSVALGAAQCQEFPR